ncbi:kelch-like protein 36 [Ptychodera flava]|uniref:kelch-like protein 36 n=1 Tax=Ptychodera flava TaxID=63121 RepID=UPI003969BD3A
MATGEQKEIKPPPATLDVQELGRVTSTQRGGMKSALPVVSASLSDILNNDVSHSADEFMMSVSSSPPQLPKSSGVHSESRPPAMESTEGKLKEASPARREKPPSPSEAWFIEGMSTGHQSAGSTAMTAMHCNFNTSPPTMTRTEPKCASSANHTAEPDLTFSDAMVMPREGPWWPPDVTIIVQNEKYEVHRSLLTEKCDFFRAMFTSGMRETWEGEVVLKEVSVRAFRVILGYLYTNAILLTEENFQEVLTTAMYLQMKFMFEAESLHPVINKSNFRHLMEFADMNGLEVVTDCVRLFMGDNYLELLESDYLQDVPKRFLETVVKGRCQGTRVVVAIVDDIRTGSSKFKYLDSEEGHWKLLTTVPMNIRGGGVAVLDNYVYVTGRSGARRAQDKAYRYNPHIDEWKEIAPPTQERDIITLVTLGDCLYAVGVGGMCHNNPNIMHTMEYDNSIEQYNPQSNTWTRKTPMPRRLCWLTATAHAGLIFVHGKTYDVQFDVSIGTNFYYNPQSDTWHEWQLGSFLFSRAYSPYQYQLSMLSDRDKFFFVGCKEKHIDEIRRYDFESGQQTVKLSSASSAGRKREAGVFAACNDKIYVIHSRSETEYFVPEQQEWRILPGSALCSHGAREYPHSSFVFHRPKSVRHIVTKHKAIETGHKTCPGVRRETTR